MEIILAKHAGFCFGVKRAMELVENETTMDEPIATYGPLIHNPQVVAQLQEKGVSIVNDIKDVEQGKVVIRSHGVGPGIYSQAESNGITILDATCPFVTKVQQAAQQALNVYEVILVAGDPNHPEVQGIAAWSDNKAIVVQSVEDAKLLGIQAKTGILLAQTTLQEKVFQEIAAALQDKVEDLKIVNTICAATRQRQDAALSLAQQVDIMIVVGGKDSSNTRKLAKLCVEAGTTTYHVEDANELNPYWFNKVRRAGITAGASTPDWIIEEVKRKMTEFSQEEDLTKEAVVDNTEDMSTSFEASLRTMKEGEVVSGVVVKVSQDEVLVDVGGKSEGIIPRREMASRVPENMNDIVKVGDELKVVILKAESDEGHILLSRKRVLEREVLEKIREAKENGEILTGEVVQVVKGGLRVDIGLLGFVPASQIERGFVDNLDKYLGKTLRMRVIDIDPKRNNVVLSQKVLLEEEYAQAKEKTWAEIAENQTRKGVVRRLTDFGAFVDLGGVDGLLHISEMSWGRIKHPSEVVNVGDELEVFVLKVDRDNKKVSLGLKQVIPNPWSKISEKYPEGSIATAKIVRIANFGAFAELEPGVDGLIHISQLSNKRVNKPSDVVQIGQEVQVKVLEVKNEEKRISLSIRALEEEAGADIVENSVD